MKQDESNHAATPGPWPLSTDKDGKPQVTHREDKAHEFISAVLELAVKYLDHPDIKAMPFAVRAEVVAKRDRLKAINAELVAALGEAEEYFDQHADAEYLPGRAAPIGNEEMGLLTEIRAALDKARKEG